MKRLTAYKMAIDALIEKRRHHAFGHKLFINCIDPPEFAKKDNAHYERMSKAIELLEMAKLLEER